MHQVYLRLINILINTKMVFKSDNFTFFLLAEYFRLTNSQKALSVFYGTKYLSKGLLKEDYNFSNLFLHSNYYKMITY